MLCLIFFKKSAGLARELPTNDNEEFYLNVVSSLQYSFPGIKADKSLVCKRSFTIDDEDLNKIREFIIKYDSKIKRPKSSYVIRPAIAYTLMSFEEGKNESTTVIAPSINQLDFGIISMYIKYDILVRRYNLMQIPVSVPDSHQKGLP